MRIIIFIYFELFEKITLSVVTIDTSRCNDDGNDANDDDSDDTIDDVESIASSGRSIVRRVARTDRIHCNRVSGPIQYIVFRFKNNKFFPYECDWLGLGAVGARDSAA